MREHFYARMKHFVRSKNIDGRDVPHLTTLQGLSHYALWKSGKDPQASAWNKTREVEGPGWVKPQETVEHEVLQGDYVAHFSWFEGVFGHIYDDSLTQIAYLKSLVPETTKWILTDTPLARNVLDFLDPEFSKRIYWVKMGIPVSVNGTLTVAVMPKIPLFSGCCRPYDHLRKWVAETHPNKTAEKKIVYYSRDSTDTRHMRKVEAYFEQRILTRIRQAMIRHGVKEELIVFNGQDTEGKTMSIKDQYDIFRAARTVIGPHGAGMLGNIMWTDPLPETCDSRVQVIEFVPGLNSTQVHPIYRSLFIRWRRWPLDFHVLLYTSNSTKESTFIDLDTLDEALDDVWGTGTSPISTSVA
jgi:hypothetical protein